jgi:hypothetical protein
MSITMDTPEEEYYSFEDLGLPQTGNKAGRRLSVADELKLTDEAMSTFRSELKRTACREVREAYAACHARGLVNASKWLIELYEAIKPRLAGNVEDREESGELKLDGESDVDFEEDEGEDGDLGGTVLFDLTDPDFGEIMLGRTYLLNGEYRRAAFATRDCIGLVGLFIHFYST